jgi:hypothetical protein
MNRIIYTIFLIGIFFLPNFTFAQFSIKSIWISSQYVQIEKQIYWTNSIPKIDTLIAPAEVFIGNDTSISFNGNLINSTYENSGYVGFYYSETEYITIEIDTSKRIFKKINAMMSTNIYKGGVGDEYRTYGKYIECSSFPYKVSKHGDTLSAYIKGSQLLGVIFKVYNTNDSTSLTTKSTTSFIRIVDVPDSAYLSVILVGTFPLAVVPISEESGSLVLLNSESKTLRFSLQSNYHNHPISCFDILGRKHNLEFLGADNTSATYSLRSLRSGVYFVNDDRETVKFMIGE